MTFFSLDLLCVFIIYIRCIYNSAFLSIPFTFRNFNQGMPSNTENRIYFESVNSAYEEPNNSVYSEI